MRLNDSTWHRYLCVLWLLSAVFACDGSASNAASLGIMDGGPPDAPIDSPVVDAPYDLRMRYPLSPPGPCVVDDAGVDDAGDTDAGVDPFVQIDWQRACADRCNTFLSSTPDAADCALQCERELDLADQACGDCYLGNIDATYADCTYGCGAPNTRVSLSTLPLIACVTCAETLERVGEAGCRAPSRAFTGRAPDDQRTVPEPLRLRAVGHEVLAFGADGFFVVRDDLSLAEIAAFDSIGQVRDVVERADGAWVGYVFDALSETSELIEFTREGTVLRRSPTVSLGVPPTMAAAPSGLIAASSTGAGHVPLVFAIDADGTSTVVDDLASAIAFDLNGDWLLSGTRLAGRRTTEVRRFSQDPTTGVWSLGDVRSIALTGRSREIWEQHLAIDADGRIVLFRHFDPPDAHDAPATLSVHGVDSQVWSVDVDWGRGGPMIAPDNAIVVGTSGPIEGAGFVVFNADGSERFRYTERGPIDDASIVVDPDGYALFAFVTRTQTNATGTTYPAQPRLLRFAL